MRWSRGNCILDSHVPGSVLGPAPHTGRSERQQTALWILCKLKLEALGRSIGGFCLSCLAANPNRHFGHSSLVLQHFGYSNYLLLHFGPSNFLLQHFGHPSLTTFWTPFSYNILPFWTPKSLGRKSCKQFGHANQEDSFTTNLADLLAFNSSRSTRKPIQTDICAHPEYSLMTMLNIYI